MSILSRRRDPETAELAALPRAPRPAPWPGNDGAGTAFPDFWRDRSADELGNPGRLPAERPDLLTADHTPATRHRPRPSRPATNRRIPRALRPGSVTR